MKRGRPINSINVVPYLDVLLVLLVIFMITAPLFNQGAVDLPSVGNADAPPPQAGAIVVVYHAGGVFSLHHRELEENHENIDEADVLTRLEAVWLLRPEAPVVLEADKNTPLGDVMRLVGKIRQLGDEVKAPGGNNIALSVKTGDET